MNIKTLAIAALALTTVCGVAYAGSDNANNGAATAIVSCDQNSNGIPWFETDEMDLWVEKRGVNNNVSRNDVQGCKKNQDPMDSACVSCLNSLRILGLSIISTNREGDGGSDNRSNNTVFTLTGKATPALLDLAD